MESPLALYRRYRPETFADVIGQDHVTTPLRAALANNRVNHAYLFSGPRGCGKTTSARILARALNCAQAPTPDPCGECESCRDLARGGPGSIDVIEIDAASHGGVDDARELREKAFFAPVRSAYKVYIIDEAHMVTTQGFNALLKLVEEPPPHLRFIFATTEPEKVIPTIRSRTHHYPFRLIPPRSLAAYLSEICEQEGVSVEPAALPLIVRAGAGSARDSLSVLDQLLGGAGPEGITHDLATGLLGYTPTSLLDDVVDAFAAGDGAAVFGVVDRVIETGQDPRRFTEDLLRRLRDLVIVAAVPDAPASGLIDVSEDQADRLVAQAARFGPAELSRAADLVATGLTEMRGATAPRLLLELICARVLLPGADSSEAGVLARVDRLEKRAAIAGGAPSPAPVREDPAPEAAQHPVQPVDEEPTPPPEPVAEAAPPPPPPPAPDPEPVVPPAPVSEEPAVPAAATSGGLSLVEVRRLWPDVVEATKLRRRVAWMHLTQNSQVVAVDGNVLTLGFSNVGARDSFVNGGCDEILRQAAIDVAGVDWTVEAIVDPGAGGQPVAESSAPASPPAGEDAPPPPRPAADSSAAAREAIRETRPAGPPDADDGRPSAEADQAVHPDDPEADSSGLAGAELLQRELGAEVIEEIRHS
ncbi:DNA polymerase III subunit gamma and tau [Nocardioides coralli]|uniref:DNA polymerase III subunit gamma and tau n=1 Tax=Nocardioides coralli TaxID=2872154 RepID=UPI001CA3F401|nr:DNA polymerase III subunit gamma and tau [Nocardioides coralli]QZY29337.1 DNA polymerase III subunit gamma and tau [Nocardioides coralli]